MSYGKKFYQTAVHVIEMVAATRSLNAVIALPYEIDGQRINATDVLEPLGHIIIDTGKLTEEDFDLAHAILAGNVATNAVVIIDDTSLKMPSCILSALRREILAGRKGFVILRKQLRKTGLEEIVEINLVDQTVYG